jgi:ABC-type branched-subunit amino acid transport system substrate-binding protein
LFPSTDKPATDEAINIAKEITKRNARLKTQDFPIKEVKMLAGDTLYNYDPTIVRGGKDVEGLIIAIPWFRGTSAAEDFAKKSKELWGGDVSWRTATSYDATQAFIKALALSPNASRTTILENLQQVNLPANETSGYPFQFTDDRERQGESILVKVKDGKFVEIESR